MSAMSLGRGLLRPRAECVLAPNASPMTLDGTNTWVLREPGGRAVGGGRPGPAVAVAPRRGARALAGDVAVVLLTHHHLDHSEAAREFAERWGAACAPSTRRTGSAPRGSATATWSRSTGSRSTSSRRPGHTADSLSFVLPAERAVLTGDTVLGRGTTVVAHPDGQLGAYLDSLDRLHALAEAHEITRHLARPRPGHRRRPRRARLLHRPPTRAPRAGPRGAAATLGGRADPRPRCPARVVEIVYADVDPVLWGAAELSVRAQLAYLQRG